MAKVITYSRRFPASHPRKGEQTNFVESFWASGSNWPGRVALQELNTQGIDALSDNLNKFLIDKIPGEKHHTIRAGHRFKAGEFFSPRVWSENPYNSPQVKIAPDTLICRVWDIKIDLKHNVVVLDGVLIEDTASIIAELAKNDGLSLEDFKNWFQKPLVGQVICWNPEINYDHYKYPTNL